MNTGKESKSNSRWGPPKNTEGISSSGWSSGPPTNGALSMLSGMPPNSSSMSLPPGMPSSIPMSMPTSTGSVMSMPPSSEHMAMPPSSLGMSMPPQMPLMNQGPPPFQWTPDGPPNSMGMPGWGQLPGFPPQSGQPPPLMQGQLSLMSSNQQPMLHMQNQPTQTQLDRIKEMSALQSQLSQAETALATHKQQTDRDIAESESNLSGQYESLNNQQNIQIEEAMAQGRIDDVRAWAASLNVSMDEMEAMVQPLIEACTKENISRAKQWIIEQSSACEAIGDLVSHYLLSRVAARHVSFDLRLHVVYLINDLLHHCKRKGLVSSLQKALQNEVVTIFCLAMELADEQKSQKLDKVLSLWKTNEYLPSELIDKMSSPGDSLARWRQTETSRRASTVQAITVGIQNQCVSMQHQHQAYVTHLQSQLQPHSEQVNQLKHQVQNLEEEHKQQLSTSIPPLMPNQSIMPGQGLPMLPSQGAMPGQGPPMMPGQGGPMPGWTPPSGPLPPFPSGPPSGGQPLGFGPMPDFSLPPPGFDPMRPPPGDIPLGNVIPARFDSPHLHRSRDHKPPMGPPAEQIPSLPYYDLPAGLMVPLIHLSDFEYRPIDPSRLRLPPPVPPTERLMGAVEAFYSPPSHERPRDCEGWEQLGLHDFFKAKDRAKRDSSFDGPIHSYQAILDELLRNGPASKPEFRQDRHMGSMNREMSPPSNRGYSSQRMMYSGGSDDGNRSGPMKRRPLPPTRGGFSRKRVSRSRSRSRSRSSSRSRSGSRSPRSGSRSRSNSRSSNSASPPLFTSAAGPGGYSAGEKSRDRGAPRDMEDRSRGGPREEMDRGRDRERPSRDDDDRDSRIRGGRGDSQDMRDNNKWEGFGMGGGDMSGFGMGGPRSEGYGMGTEEEESRGGFSSNFLGTDNKGAQMMQRMGWSGNRGLGVREQGRTEPVANDQDGPRNKSDMFKGVGAERADDFEQFRQRKSQGFSAMMKSRTEERPTPR